MESWLHSLHFAATAKAAAVQPSVFDAGPAESFSVDGDRQLVRTVRRRGAVKPVMSSMGPLIGPSNGDLRAAADLSWLRQASVPPVVQSAPLRVVDLFSGCGAMSVGLREACRAIGRGFEPVA